MTIGIIAQARTGSKRLPRKIYKDINGKYTLQRVLEEISKSTIANKIILAMPTYDEGEFVDRWKNGDFIGRVDNRFKTYFGHADDLVDRYFNATRDNEINLIVRVTCDCPLIQGEIIDEAIMEYLKNGYNGFMGNNRLISSCPYPDGTDIEIFPYWMLCETKQLTNSPFHLEHVTPFMYRRGTQYKIYQFLNVKPNTQINMRFGDFSLDTQKDYELILKITNFYDKYLNSCTLRTEALNKAIEDVNDSRTFS